MSERERIDIGELFDRLLAIEADAPIYVWKTARAAIAELEALTGKKAGAERDRWRCEMADKIREAERAKEMK